MKCAVDYQSFFLTEPETRQSDWSLWTEQFVSGTSEEEE